MSDPRDIRTVASPASSDGSAGRNVITAIGIDRYRHWRPLNNAVGDANATRALLRRLGFQEITEPLLDDRATGDAIDALVTDELTALSPSDSLIVFYAGHGGARTQHIGGKQVTTGYLIPVDGANASNRASTWIEIDAWLRRISKLPPRHILVILDACYSGIALSPVVKWGRDGGAMLHLPFATLQARPSRLVITSALNDEIAMDSGPVHGHSLFTGDHDHHRRDSGAGGDDHEHYCRASGVGEGTQEYRHRGYGADGPTTGLASFRSAGCAARAEAPFSDDGGAAASSTSSRATSAPSRRCGVHPGVDRARTRARSRRVPQRSARRPRAPRSPSTASRSASRPRPSRSRRSSPPR